MSETEHGRTVAIIKLVASLVANDTSLANNYGKLVCELVRIAPELRDQKKCFNCGAFMRSYEIKFDAWQAVLLLRMAEKVRENLHKGAEFTIANQVHVPSLDAPLTVLCKTTQLSKLGIIAQLKNKSGKRVPGIWVVTRRGFSALRGDSVPGSVVVFRGRIEERSDKMVTINEALQHHVSYVEKVIGKGKVPKQDFRTYIVSYKPIEWTGEVFHGNKLL